MQITLNQSEVSDVVLGYVQAQLGLDDSNNFHVEVHEDGTIAVFVNEDVGNEEAAAPADKPQRKPRQRRQKAESAPVETKPVVELAKDAAVGNQQQASTQTSSAPDAQPSEAASSSAAGGVAEQAEEPETPVDPQPTEPAVAVEEQPAEKPEPEVVKDPEPAPEERPRTQSLFANLRKPNNQQN